MSISTGTYHQTAITAEKAKLEGARAEFAHCPSWENGQKVTAAERRMDAALDAWSSERQ